MSDNAESVGKIVFHRGVRDAVHVPIISAIAMIDMQPGSWVSVDENLEARLTANHIAVGVVDPYLPGQVKKGESFWVHLKPGSIKALEHHWTHRTIPNVPAIIPDKELARQRLEEFAVKTLNITLDRMVGVIERCRRGGDPLMSHSYEGESEYDGFWSDYCIYTGKTDPNFDSNYDGYFFHCGGCS